MKRGNSAVVSLSDPTQNEAALLLICNWLSGKYVAQQAENVRQASEIIRLKDELADVRDILQHRITTPPLDMSVIENNSTVVTELLEKLTLSQMADSAIAKTMIVQSQKAEDKTPAKSVHF